jgi:hypothetical protein
MKSPAGEPLVEVNAAEKTDRGFRTVCRFSEPYLDPVAPGALYDKPSSGNAQFLIHRLTKRDGLTITFDTFGVGDSPPPVGRQFYYRAWWRYQAMDAALDVATRWTRLAYPDDGTHEHCLFTWKAISSHTGQRIGYCSQKYGWITEQAYMDFIVRDIYRLREN